MHLRTLALGSLAALSPVLFAVFATTARAQDCPAAKPFLLTTAVTPAIGQSPMWATWGKGALAWQGPDKAVNILFVRDVTAKGPAVLSGRNRASKAKVKFGKTGSTLGLKEERLQLDALGTKPRTATAKDFERYSFHTLDVWFPEPGCYEVEARVGRQVSTLVFNVDKLKGK